MKKETLSAIADEINAFLKRFEADPAINTFNKPGGVSKYYKAFSCASGRFVYVTYITYQGSSHLSRGEALQYLEWLKAGNVGRHYSAIK